MPLGTEASSLLIRCREATTNVPPVKGQQLIASDDCGTSAKEMASRSGAGSEDEARFDADRAEWRSDEWRALQQLWVPIDPDAPPQRLSLELSLDSVTMFIAALCA